MAWGSWPGKSRIKVPSSRSRARILSTVCSLGALLFKLDLFFPLLIVEHTLAGRAEDQLVCLAHLVDLLRGQGHVASLADITFHRDHSQAVTFAKQHGITLEMGRFQAGGFFLAAAGYRFFGGFETFYLLFGGFRLFAQELRFTGTEVLQSGGLFFQRFKSIRREYSKANSIRLSRRISHIN